MSSRFRELCGRCEGAYVVAGGVPLDPLGLSVLLRAAGVPPDNAVVEEFIDRVKRGAVQQQQQMQQQLTARRVAPQPSRTLHRLTRKSTIGAPVDAPAADGPPTGGRRSSLQGGLQDSGFVPSLGSFRRPDGVVSFEPTELSSGSYGNILPPISPPLPAPVLARPAFVPLRLCCLLCSLCDLTARREELASNESDAVRTVWACCGGPDDTTGSVSYERLRRYVSDTMGLDLGTDRSAVVPSASPPPMAPRSSSIADVMAASTVMRKWQEKRAAHLDEVSFAELQALMEGGGIEAAPQGGRPAPHALATSTSTDHLSLYEDEPAEGDGEVATPHHGRGDMFEHRPGLAVIDENIAATWGALDQLAGLGESTDRGVVRALDAFRRLPSEGADRRSRPEFFSDILGRLRQRKSAAVDHDGHHTRALERHSTSDGGGSIFRPLAPDGQGSDRHPSMDTGPAPDIGLGLGAMPTAPVAVVPSQEQIARQGARAARAAEAAIHALTANLPAGADSPTGSPVSADLRPLPAIASPLKSRLERLRQLAAEHDVRLDKGPKTARRPPRLVDAAVQTDPLKRKRRPA